MTSENEKNDLQANIGDWDSPSKPKNEKKSENKNSNKKKADWMAFPKPGDYTVRFVGNFVEFLKYSFEPFGTARIITHQNYIDNGLDPAKKAGFFPKETCAIHVFDRGDENKVKILERSRAFFEPLFAFKKNNDINPANLTKAPEFIITVVWTNGEKKAAKYTIAAKMKACPLTEDEMKFIKEKTTIKVKEMKDGVAEYVDKEVPLNIYPLKDIYKATPIEKIQEAWNALPAESKVKKFVKKDDAKTDETKKDGGKSSQASTSPQSKVNASQYADKKDEKKDEKKDSQSTDWLGDDNEEIKF